MLCIICAWSGVNKWLSLEREREGGGGKRRVEVKCTCERVGIILSTPACSFSWIEVHRHHTSSPSPPPGHCHSFWWVSLATHSQVTVLHTLHIAWSFITLTGCCHSTTLSFVGWLETLFYWKGVCQALPCDMYPVPFSLLALSLLSLWSTRGGECLLLDCSYNRETRTT